VDRGEQEAVTRCRHCAASAPSVAAALVH
jgi:hypothetical protein